MALKKVWGWVAIGAVSALVSYAIALLMRQQTITSARAIHDQTIGDVNDLMKGLQIYAKTNFGRVE